MSYYAIIALVQTAYVILQISISFSSTASAKTRYAVEHVHFWLPTMYQTKQHNLICSPITDIKIIKNLFQKFQRSSLRYVSCGNP